MALAKIIKINLIVQDKLQEKTLKLLQGLHLLEIIDPETKEDVGENLNEELSKLDYQIAGVKFALDFLGNFDTRKKPLREKIDSSIRLKSDQIEKIVSRFDHESIVAKSQDLESQINEKKNRIDKISSEQRSLAFWKNLSFAPSERNLPKNYSVKYLSAATAVFAEFVLELQEKAPFSVTERVTEASAKEVFAAVIFRADQEQAVNEIISLLQLKIYELPDISSPIPKYLDDLASQKQKEKGQIERLEALAGGLAINIRNLKIVDDFLNWRKNRFSARLKATNTAKTFSMKAWIDEKSVEPLEKEMSKITKNFVIEKIKLDDEEAPPVKFQNTWAKPFEAVTEIYGAPQSHELDPTPFLAPFFTLFFGLALSDAGYGLVMALGIVAVIHFLKIPKSSQKLLRVLFWGGIASFIIGVFTGGWFGIDLGSLPAVIGGPLIALQLIDPLEDALIIFYIALGLGVIQVLFGLTLDIWWKLRSGFVKEGLLGSGLWVVTIISLLLFAGSSMGLLAGAAAAPAKYVLFTAVAGLVLGKAFMSKNFFIGLPSGILGLYSIVGYFSDVLSYSRLLALGLTTGIIGIVVNLIAGLVLGIPFVGWLAAFLVLIGGHTFNLAINALGAFIHSGRLQYIEFFPKFMEGGGRAFQPFGRESNYVRIMN